MATLELDADFVAGLRLMFSTSRNAPDALRAMLDEAIRFKFGTSKPLGSFQTAKVKVEEDFTSSHIISERNSEDSGSSKEDDDNVLDLEMMEEDLACAICREMNIGPRNRLVECLECHALYHQECHRPAIHDQDISDPRMAWYCSTCSRNMHRPAPVEPAPATTSTTTSSKQSSSKSSSSKSSFKTSGSGSSRDSPTNSKPSSSSSNRSESSSQSLFKRADKSSNNNSSSSNSSSHKSAPSGLAALAASLQPSTKSSSSGSSSHKSSSSSSNSKSSSTSSSSKNFSSSGSSSSQGNKGSPSSPTLSGLNADRRLQNMKKKAAAKIQEKRKHSK